MQFSFTTEQLEFRSVLRRYFEQHAPATEARRLMATQAGWERGQWTALNEQLGLAGVHLPEAFGGHGFSYVELGIVFEEMGRALVCTPYLASVALAATAILEAGTDAQKEILLPSLASGEVVGAFAVTERNGLWDTAGIEAAATPDGNGWRISGTKSFVVDGATADLLVVAARRPGTTGDDGLSLFTVSPTAQGVSRRPLQALDPTRKIAEIVFEGAPAELLGEEGAAAGPLAKTLDLAAICLAHEMVGGAERLRESALEFSKGRVQFGRPIASFQTMKHKQADMLLEVELAKSAAYYAAAAAADGAEDWPAAASLAKAAASEAYLQTAIHTIQIHGGIGFTWDNDTHLWFKRAKASEVFLGDPTWRRERMMQAWGH